MTTRFSDLALIEPIQRALTAEKYETPTPIQTQAIPHLLAGRDLLGIAQTGTGKTAAFGLPILQRLFQDKTQAGPKNARCLILTPTRELAVQIADSLRTYGRNLHLRMGLVYGGVGQRPQVDTMARGVDILVATPGRLMDLMNQGHIRLDKVSIFGVSSVAGETKTGGGAGGSDSRAASGSEDDKPASCPTCGSTEMLRLSEAMTLMALDPVPPGSSAERSNVHCMFSASEECWVCKPSLGRS